MQVLGSGAMGEVVGMQMLGSGAMGEVVGMPIGK
jgi:hypothetical protein